MSASSWTQLPAWFPYASQYAGYASYALIQRRRSTAAFTAVNASSNAGHERISNANGRRNTTERQYITSTTCATATESSAYTQLNNNSKAWSGTAIRRQ